MECPSRRPLAIDHDQLPQEQQQLLSDAQEEYGEWHTSEAAIFQVLVFNPGNAGMLFLSPGILFLTSGMLFLPLGMTLGFAFDFAS